MIGLEDGILAGRAEVPGVVGRVVAVQIHVPELVEPSVAGWLLQLLGRLFMDRALRSEEPQRCPGIEIAEVDDSRILVYQGIGGE